MAPPKSACSLLAQGYITIGKIRKAIADIRAALVKAQRIKNALKFGTILSGIADVVGAEFFSVIQSVVSSVVGAIMRSYSAVVASVVEAFLSPLLFILSMGPESVFALVNLPLKEAISAGSKEKLYINKAKHNIDIVIRIISRWSIEIGGGKYADKMAKAIPYIEAAIKRCDTIIAKLDKANTDKSLVNIDPSFASSFFDVSAYTSLRSNIQAAIDITKSDSVVANYDLIENRRREYSDRKYLEYSAKIKQKYRILKREIYKKYAKSRHTMKDVAEYTTMAYHLKRLEDIELKNARARADRDAAMNKELYKDILLDIRDQLALEGRQLTENLYLFIKNIGTAYIYYRNCQAMTHSVYTIRSLISKLITQMIRIMTMTGNALGESASWTITLTKNLLEQVLEIFNSSIYKFNHPSEGGISATGLSAKLAVGHGLLKTADSTIAATITESLIKSINADEEYLYQSDNINKLAIEIANIPDWDGKLNVWAVNPINSHVPPYTSLITSATAVIATIGAIGMVSNSQALSTIQARIIELNREFRKLSIHNGKVMSALGSYTMTPNPYVENIRDILSKHTNITNWLTTFSVVSALIAMGLEEDFLRDGLGKDDIPNLDNCILSYKELFPEDEVVEAIIFQSTLKPAPAMLDDFTSKYEQNDMNVEANRRKNKNISIVFNQSELAGNSA